MSHVRVITAAALSILLGAIALGLAGPARATTEAGIALDNSHREAHRSYGPLANGAYDQALVPGSTDCDASPSDLLIPVTVKLKSNVGSLFDFTVNWPDANDYINVYLLDKNDHVVAQASDGPPSTPKRPKQLHLGSMDNGTYNLCIVNSAGANTGVTLDVKLSFVNTYRPPPPAATAAPAPPPQAPVVTPPPTIRPAQAPAATAEAVATPGPDAPGAKQGLSTLASGKQAANKSGRSVAQLIFLILTIVIGAAGVVVVALRIRRDTA